VRDGLMMVMRTGGVFLIATPIIRQRGFFVSFFAARFFMVGSLTQRSTDMEDQYA
jgi:hypothetical protein